MVGLPSVFSLDLVSSSYSVSGVSSNPLTSVELESSSFSGEVSSRFISPVFVNDSSLNNKVSSPVVSSSSKRSSSRYFSNPAPYINDSIKVDVVNLSNSSIVNMSNFSTLVVNDSLKDVVVESPAVITGNAVSDGVVYHNDSSNVVGSNKSGSLNIIFLISVSLIAVLLGLVGYSSYVYYSSEPEFLKENTNTGGINPSLNVGDAKISSINPNVLVVDDSIKNEFLTHAIFDKIINNEISDELHDLMKIHDGMLIEKIKESPSEHLMYERLLLAISRSYHHNFSRIKNFKEDTADEVILKSFFFNLPKYVHVLKKYPDKKILVLIANQTKYALDTLSKAIEDKKNVHVK